MRGIVDFACWVAVISTAAAFFLGLLVKWGVVEWLQVHAPSDFLARLFNCKFCMSWWVSVGISLTLSVVTGQWWLLLVPVCSTVIARELW